MTPAGGAAPVSGPAWTSWLGVVTLLLGVLFTAHAGNEWMRQVVLDSATPAGLALPAAECPADELEEEGLSVAECRQLVEDVRSYLVSRPDWFGSLQAALAGLGTVLALASILAGAMLANQRAAAVGFGMVVFALLAAVDAGHFIAAQMAGPILRGIHLPAALLWFFVHLGLALAFHVARRAGIAAPVAESCPARYGRFAVASHWFIVVAIFFLFVSSWWMLALPLPSADFRYREFPFQLHKNLGITILLLLVAMALIRLARRAPAASDGSDRMARAQLAGHVALYLLVFAVCVTGYLSSSYSGWSTALWWVVELPYWGREDEELNQLFSDLHLLACWGLLIVMAVHIAAALLHALRNDTVLRRILRW